MKTKTINEDALKRIIAESVKNVLQGIVKENKGITDRDMKEPFQRMEKAINEFLDMFYDYMQYFAYDEERDEAKAAADALFKGLLAVERCFRHPEASRGEKVWDTIAYEPEYTYMRGPRDW